MAQIFAPTSITPEKLQRSRTERERQVSTSAVSSDEPSNEPITIDLLSEYRDLVALQPEWDALWSSVSSPGYQQSSTYTLVCWREMHDDSRSALRCIVVRQGGKAVLIWPLLIKRAGLVKILSPVWSTGAEYTEPLVQDGPHALDLISRAWLSARSSIAADIISIPQVKVGSCFHTVVSKETPADIETDTTYILKWDKAWTDWDTYFKTISAGHDLKETQRRKRRLAEQGNVEFQIIDGSSEGVAMIDWCLQRKRDWAERVDKRGSWLYSERYRNFLVAFFSSTSDLQHVVIFVLKINGSPIAVKLAAYNEEKLDGISSAFDDSWRKYAPGSLLDEYLVRWTFERSLEIDFGSGTEPYKRFWSRNNAIPVVSYRFSGSALGTIAMQCWKWRRQWRIIRKQVAKRSTSN
jgi:CelD/BcsL family acetyltransferase involved in cellulose biosynthesis